MMQYLKRCRFAWPREIFSFGFFLTKQLEENKIIKNDKRKKTKEIHVM